MEPCMVPGKELSNKDDELKPMHPKDSKPPPEFSGARKDFMVWHETFHVYAEAAGS